MALSLSNFLYATVAFASFIHWTAAATVTYDFNIGWVRANPDGQFERPTMGINGQWPLPPIVVNKGDRLVVNAKNDLGNATTSLHFHGLFQNGTTEMDGPIGVTQCGILPGKAFTYNFTIEQPGTYWYHAHFRGQYPDGLRGPLIVHDPEDPFKDMYDEEVVLTLSDWYHDQMTTLVPQFLTLANPTGAEPVPNAALFNDTQNVTVAVQPGKTYLIRMVNMAAFAAQYFWIEDHEMRIVEVDGVYTEPATASMVYLTAAQRCSVLVTMSNDTSKNFPFVGSMDQDLFDQVPDGLNPNVTGWLVYDATKELPEPAFVDEFEPHDDFLLVPQDGMEPLPEPDHQITLAVKMDNLGDGANYAFFNDVTYVKPKVPTLFTALTTGATSTNASIYGENSIPFVLNKGDIVEIVLNNDDPGKHPFHLHGHHFQVIHRSEEDAGFYDPSTMTITPPKSPMRRDVFMVRPGGFFILRFVADNPGVWLFHCHIEWHVDSGLVATMIEAPLELQAQKKANPIPQSHYQACIDTNTPVEGNAAGNTVDLFDLTGANVSHAPLPAGFTVKGIVALMFSCISAFVGMAVIAWYGAAPISKQS